MKLLAKQNRELIMINAQNTQNENDAEKITLQVPEQYEDFNKKIVFVTPDGNVWDIITNNEYLIKKAITKYKQVDFYIWLTKGDVDFRSQTKTLKFYHNVDASDEITDEEIGRVNTVVNLLEQEITKVVNLEDEIDNKLTEIDTTIDDVNNAIQETENLDLDAEKVNKTTTVTITKKDGTEKNVSILDGRDGTGISTIQKTSTSGLVDTYTITFTDGTTTTYTVTNGDKGDKGDTGEVTTEEFLKAFVTDSASGSVASFPDGADNIPLKSCIVRVEPVQEGSGDPSLENVRPITGWTGCEVQRTGKNLLPLNIWGGFNYNATVGKVFTPTMSDKSWTQGENSITYETTATYTTLSLMTPLLHKGTYHLGLHKLSTNSLRYSRYTLDKSFTVKQSDYISNVTNISVAITLDEDGYIAFYLDNGSTASQTVEITIQVEVGNTESAYVPYTGQTYPITFPTEAGTVYGAYVDVTGGELVATHAEVDMGTLSWTYYASGNYFYAVIPDRIVYLETMPKVVSACDKYAYFGFGASSELQNNMPNANYGFTTTSAKRYIYLKDNQYTNVDDLVASLSGTQLVYALTKDSITTYTISQIEIKTLLGQNNLWADTGNSEIEYRADTELYIDKQTPDVPVDDVQINGTSIVADGVANVPIATASSVGVVRTSTDRGTMMTGNILAIRYAESSTVKAGTNSYCPVVPNYQHESTFYGLAKAAGDTTQSQSSNPVGTYTDDAKTAIRTMFGIVTLTQAEYDSIAIKSESIIYMIVED